MEKEDIIEILEKERDDATRRLINQIEKLSEAVARDDKIEIREAAFNLVKIAYLRDALGWIILDITASEKEGKEE